ncbi:acyl-CoA Delta-9 desaturase-like isoform X2 [Euwallacea similis]
MDAETVETPIKISKESQSIGTDFNFKHKIVWKNVVAFIILHLIAIHALYLLVALKYRLTTFVFFYLYMVFASVGVTGGAHRLWTHRTYQANLPLRIFLMLAQTTALQNNIYEWARDHRVHHKFTDTDADPHNSKRGFFFSHMGWLMCKKHPAVCEKGQCVDISDVIKDPVVKFQMRYYKLMAFFFNMIIPTLTVWYFFGEDLWPSFELSIFRTTFIFHGTWLVNSAAHLWGTKPYNKNINPTESPLVISMCTGEGFHNYHHSFPWDYKAAELGHYGNNWTTAVIDFMAKIGWAKDLKTASPELVKKR